MEMSINGSVCEVMVDPLLDENGRMVGAVTSSPILPSASVPNRNVNVY